MNKGFMRQVLFLIAGLLLMPLLVGTVFSFYNHLTGCSAPGKAGWFFLIGFGIYITIHILFYKPITVHVYGHELTHVIWAWIFGGEVKQFKASKNGGRVIVTKSNFFIRLAPYFFPLYAVIVIILYRLISLALRN